MFTEANMQELVVYQSEAPVLSVFLNTDPSQGNADVYKLHLRGMLKEVDLSKDVAEVENYFDHQYDWSGRSVAIFSCAQEGFFRAYSFAVPLRNRIRVSNQPHVKPLVDLLDHYGGYGVAIVDQQGARMFSIHLGEVREQEGVLGETVRHTKRGGASTVAGRRGGVAGRTNYMGELAERNMREAAEFAAHFFVDNNVRRVLIGGTDDNVAQFRTLLPKSWQSLIVGTFPMSMSASKVEVLERTMQIGRQAEYNHEEQLVKKVVTSSAKGRGGVVGLEDTLSAVHEGRMQTLVLRDGYRAPGFRCLGCGYVTTQMLSDCPFCGGGFENIPDAVESALHKFMQTGDDINVLFQDHVIPGFENIGGLLRY